MTFDPRELDDIRDRIKVSEVVGRKYQLRRQGAEFVAVDDRSLTVNDQKGIWHDFAKEGRGGDIFAFLQQEEGYSFVDAVRALAEQAGVSLKNGAVASSGGAKKDHASNGADHGRAQDGRGGSDHAGAGHHGARGVKTAVATWDYLDPENNLLYQVVRQQEKLQDGSWRLTAEGKPWKTFLQRRPCPDVPGTFIMGLDVIDRQNGQPLEFMRYKDGWIRYNEDNFAKWRCTDRRTFEHLGNVEHWLYNANAAIDELAQPVDEQPPIFIPEGEAKVDVLTEWGLLAVTNSGGAKHFTEAHAEFFRNAADVVILQDNDRAGAERVARIAPMLRAVGARVRALNFRDVWPACPPKGDVKDWRDKGGGTRDVLLEIVDKLKPWQPEPYRSKFGAKTWRDLGGVAKPYPWRIKGIVPLVDNMLIMGPSRSGKTFETIDLMMHVHNGEDFAGRRVEPGGFVYLTYEGATGFENRLRAYLKHAGMREEDLHSLAWLTRPPGIFASEDNVTALAEEVVKIAEGFKLPLAATVIDTHNAATRGSSEIKSEDLNKIMERYAIIAEKTGAPLWIIGHTNAEGKHRGNEIFFNNIEAALLVQRVTDDKGKNDKRDEDGHIIRRVSINKQREGDDRISWDFVLKSVQIGIDPDGDPITSMVSVEPAQQIRDVEPSKRDRPDGYQLSPNNALLFSVMLRLLDEVGEPPPPALKLPASITRVIKWADLGIGLKQIDPRERDESIEKYRNRIKARTRRFREELLPYRVIGIAEMALPNDGHESYVWPTGRRVYGRGLGQWPREPKKKDDGAPVIDQATGQPIDTVF